MDTEPGNGLDVLIATASTVPPRRRSRYHPQSPRDNHNHHTQDFPHTYTHAPFIPTSPACRRPTLTREDAFCDPSTCTPPSYRGPLLISKWTGPGLQLSQPRHWDEDDRLAKRPRIASSGDGMASWRPLQGPRPELGIYLATPEPSDIETESDDDYFYITDDDNGESECESPPSSVENTQTTLYVSPITAATSADGLATPNQSFGYCGHHQPKTTPDSTTGS